MAQRLRVEDSVVTGASHRLLAASLVVERARTALVTRLDASNGCWGESDEAAQQFVKEYVPGRDAVLEGAVQVSTLLRRLGERVATTATSFVALEQDNTTGAQALLLARTATVPVRPPD